MSALIGSGSTEHLALIDSQIQELNVQMITQALQMAKIEVKIEEVEVKIEQVEAEILTLNKDSLPHGEKAQLRAEKEQLRNKEAQLRNKEAQLRNKEAQLRAEKEQLRAEKGNLLTIVGLEKLEISTKCVKPVLLTTPENQGSASSFANAKVKNPVHGFGHLPTSFRIDPTVDQRVSRRLIPSSAEITSVSQMLPCMGEKATLAAKGEDETCGVRSVLETMAAKFPYFVSAGSNLKMPKIRGPSIVTSYSVPDFVWMNNGKIVGILEAKDGTASTLVALRQAAITAMTIVSNLRSRGLSPEQIVLPVAGCTGMAIQFGAVICLEPSFGTFLATSDILSLSNVEQNQLAVAFLNKASACALETVRLLVAVKVPTDIQFLQLNVGAYWIKYITDDAFSRGLGLFVAACSDRFNVGPGLEHMGRALTLLYQHEAAREFVAFPLSVRSPDCDEGIAGVGDCYMIIYEDLAKLGYRIGTPDRLEDEGKYQRWLAALRLAVQAIHDAEVLHCDLYPSNIMWLESGADQISIKIIDWDCAHCLAEGSFCPRISQALCDHKPSRPASFSKEHDLRYIQTLAADVEVEVEEDLSDEWRALASNDKAQIDNAFYRLFSREK